MWGQPTLHPACSQDLSPENLFHLLIAFGVGKHMAAAQPCGTGLGTGSLSRTGLAAPGAAGGKKNSLSHNEALCVSKGWHKGFSEAPQSLFWHPQRRLAVARGSCPAWKYPGVGAWEQGMGTGWALGVSEHGMSLFVHA